MLSHLWLKNRSIVSRWKIDYVELNKHRFLARVQMSLHRSASAAARGDKTRHAWWQERVLFAVLLSLCRPWSLPSSARGLPRVASGVVGKMSMGKARRCPARSHMPLCCGTWLWRSGLIWGPERNSEKGTGAKTRAITSERRTLPLQAQGGSRWASLPCFCWGVFNSKVTVTTERCSSEGCSALGCD